LTDPLRVALGEFLAQAGVEAVRVRRVSAPAAVNRSWSVWTDDGRRLAARCQAHNRTPHEAAYELALIEHLWNRGWDVPAPLSAPVEIRGRVFTLHRWVTGRPLEPSRAADAARGAMLARLHAALMTERDRMGQRPGWQPLPWLERSIGSAAWTDGMRFLSAADDGLANAVQAAAERVIAELDARALAKLPMFLLHGDFADWNVLGSGSTPRGVIDFGLAHLGIRPWELAIARIHRAPGLLDGYRAEAARLGIPLTPEELEWLPAVNRSLRIEAINSAFSDGLVTGPQGVVFIRRQLERYERGLGPGLGVS
jgi:Ser/Thr protein kinase RdoA (MazF antagonist)